MLSRALPALRHPTGAACPPKIGVDSGWIVQKPTFRASRCRLLKTWVELVLRSIQFNQVLLFDIIQTYFGVLLEHLQQGACRCQEPSHN
mmetsp:Transcript_55150/g.87416  ORF Transcript_55150/g.87416 Transcript_55150/m.87416 type:complete len:89 (+) Transcript_55150:553-819(+)